MPTATKEKEPKFSFFAPFKKSLKSIHPKNGMYYIGGYASTGDLDYQGERVNPAGIDDSYFKQDGYVDYEHDMSKTIGVPVECHIDDKGFYVKAALFADQPLVKKIINLDKEIAKAGVKRHLGYSIEGQVKHRDSMDPSVIDSILITGVAVTKNPANTDASWSLLQKSINAYNYNVKHHCPTSFKSIYHDLRNHVNPKQRLIKSMVAFLRKSDIDYNNDSISEEKRVGLDDFMRKHNQPTTAKDMIHYHNVITKALTEGYGVSPSTQTDGAALRPQSLAYRLHNLSYSIGDIDMSPKRKKNLFSQTLKYLDKNYSKDIYSHELALQLMTGCSLSTANKSIKLAHKSLEKESKNETQQ